MTRFLSLRQLKIEVKNPLGRSCSVTFPFGFHLALMHPCRAFSVGQNPMNLPMSSWSLMYYISPLIVWVGSSILGHLVAIGLHVAKVALGASVVPCASVVLFSRLFGLFGLSLGGVFYVLLSYSFRPIGEQCELPWIGWFVSSNMLLDISALMLGEELRASPQTLPLKGINRCNDGDADWVSHCCESSL